MGDTDERDRVTSTQLTAPRETREQLARDLVLALEGEQDFPPAYLYDARGSELFEQITKAEEYYLTRAEASILEREAKDIVEEIEPHELVELGSGSSSKTGVLIDAMQAAGTGDRYAALDVSAAALDSAAGRLAAEHPGLSIYNFVGDFHTDLVRIPRTGRRLLMFLGSTIGNMHPPERTELLTAATESLAPGDGFLVGIDLVKDLDVLLPAYDDVQGVAAAFARNLLAVIDRELEADIPLDAFGYEAVWDAEGQRVEMRLVATREVTATIAALDRTVTFAPGEAFVTEHSYKFRIEEFAEELATVGLGVTKVYTDPEQRFAVVLARPVAT